MQHRHSDLTKFSIVFIIESHDEGAGIGEKRGFGMIYDNILTDGEIGTATAIASS